MPSLDLRSLLNRLSGMSRTALEGAAALALSRTHYDVEIEHWLARLLDAGDSDLVAILSHTGVDAARMLEACNRALDRLQTGNGRAPGLAPDLVALAREAWLLASIEHGMSRVRSGHLLWALLADDALGQRAAAVARLLRPIPLEALKADYAGLTLGSKEIGGSKETGAADFQGDGPAATESGTPRGGGALDRFTSDLTAQARAGTIDPILGRDGEIRQVIDILTRRRQNNPILTGEAGVGKTAVVEGFAARIAAGDVPDALREVVVRTLDLGLLQAGAGIKGEFENRLRSVIDEVKASPKPVILFIDEAHTMIGAGNQAGGGDAANLLKPALARGELRTIAATTWAEYKKYFEKDAALSRRFQVVKVDEPDEATAIAMMRGLAYTLEAHHGVRILDSALAASVHLSARYIPSRQLPDKSVSLLDTACARVAMSQSALPASIEGHRRRLSLIETETAILTREAASGGAHETRLSALADERSAAADELGRLEQRWSEERALVAEIGEARRALEAGEAAEGAQAALAAAHARLAALQGEHPLIHPVVDEQAVAEIVANWTGIPTGRMREDEIRATLDLKTALAARIIGQDHALDAVARAIRISRARLTDPRKPVGVFLMVGTSGVGKTETALALADLLYGGAQNVTTLNMSEFKEEHKVSLLMGSPPGYVGYGEGGVLTEAVRRRPYSVILLDEMEKAHPGVQDVFYQVFDKGTMKDGEGRDIDFRNALIIMTSNAGTGLISALFADPDTAPDAAGLSEALRPELSKHFKPAFLGRVTTVPYLPLGDDTMRRIVRLQLDRIARRVGESWRARFSYDDALVEQIAIRCTESEAGARNIETILSQTLLAELSGEILGRVAAGAPIETVHVGLGGDGGFTYDVA